MNVVRVVMKLQLSGCRRENVMPMKRVQMKLSLHGENNSMLKRMFIILCVIDKIKKELLKRLA